MKKFSKVLLVALIGFGIIAVVPAVKAGDAETCWGRCDNDTAQNIAPTDKTDVEACWGRCDTDAAQDPMLSTLSTWEDPAGKDEERETMASYR